MWFVIILLILAVIDIAALYCHLVKMKEDHVLIDSDELLEWLNGFYDNPEYMGTPSVGEIICKIKELRGELDE